MITSFVSKKLNPGPLLKGGGGSGGWAGVEATKKHCETLSVLVNYLPAHLEGGEKAKGVHPCKSKIFMLRGVNKRDWRGSQMNLLKPSSAFYSHQQNVEVGN